MKVLLVTEYFTPKMFGGGQISAHQLAKTLVKKGLTVFVLTAHFSGLKRVEEMDGFTVVRTLKTGENPNAFKDNLRRLFWFQKSIKKELPLLDKKENFDIIHFLNTTAIPNFKINKKTFATINGYTNFCPKRNLFYKEKKACEECNPGKFVKCIVNSKFLGKYKMPWYVKYNPIIWMSVYSNHKKNNRNLDNVQNYFAISGFTEKMLIKNGVKKKNIFRVPNIIDIKDSDKIFHLKDKGVKIVFIGVLEKIKGTELVIRAFNKVNGDAKLLIFGDGSERKKLEKIAGPNVRFYGDVRYEFIPSIYKQSDAIVQSSLWPEPFSRIMLEATYFGKPIIATDNGGNSEGVIVGQNGFLVRNEEELVEKLNILINNENIRKDLGIKSRKIFEERFEKEMVTKKILNAYKKT